MCVRGECGLLSFEKRGQRVGICISLHRMAPTGQIVWRQDRRGRQASEAAAGGDGDAPAQARAGAAAGADHGDGDVH